MPDLSFTIEDVGPAGSPAEPLLGFRVRATDATAGRTRVHSVSLHAQVRVQPARRKYSDRDQGNLQALFGTPDRWSQTVRDFPWASVGATVPSFAGETDFELPVPCDLGDAHAVSRYFEALEGGDAPVLVLFSGTIVYEAYGIGPQVGFIPWDREARCRVPVAVWLNLFAETVAP